MSTLSQEFELESYPEFEFEWEEEDEFGDILGGLARNFLGEGEGESEWEYEFEDEGESETEAFFGRLQTLVDREASSPALHNVAMEAAHAAMNGLTMPPGAAGALAHVASLLTESEYEDEYEAEFELNPVRKVYPDAILEHLGHEAAEAETEGEAFAFLAPLVPLAAKAAVKLAPKAIHALAKSTPNLVRGLTSVGKTLLQHPGAKPLMRALPTVVKRTVNTIARQAANGHPVTANSAVRTLAKHTANTLGHPNQSVQAYQRSKALDRQFHKTAPAPVKAGMVHLRNANHVARGAQQSASIHPHGQWNGHRPGYRWINGRWVAGPEVRTHSYRPDYRWINGRWVGGPAGYVAGSAPAPPISGPPRRVVTGRPASYGVQSAPVARPRMVPAAAPGRSYGRPVARHHCGCCCCRGNS